MVNKLQTIKACSKEAPFIIKDLEAPRITSRWSFTCFDHLGELVGNALLGTSEVKVELHPKVHGALIGPSCEYGVE